jgi:hypothetical protein
MARNEPFIPPPVIRALVAFLALGSIIAFAVIFGVGIGDVVSAKNGTPPNPNDAFLYVATALATLVGGIVAVGFGVPMPTPQKDESGPGRPAGNPSLVSQSIDGLGSLAVPLTAVRQVIGALYAIVYMSFGVAAGVVWLANSEETSDLVKNLATTFLGLVIPIVAAYAKPNYGDDKT